MERPLPTTQFRVAHAPLFSLARRRSVASSSSFQGAVSGEGRGPVEIRSTGEQLTQVLSSKCITNQITTLMLRVKETSGWEQSESATRSAEYSERLTNAQYASACDEDTHGVRYRFHEYWAHFEAQRLGRRRVLHPPSCNPEAGADRRQLSIEASRLDSEPEPAPLLPCAPHDGAQFAQLRTARSAVEGPSVRGRLTEGLRPSGVSRRGKICRCIESCRVGGQRSGLPSTSRSLKTYRRSFFSQSSPSFSSSPSSSSSWSSWTNREHPLDWQLRV